MLANGREGKIQHRYRTHEKVNKQLPEQDKTEREDRRKVKTRRKQANVEKDKGKKHK